MKAKEIQELIDFIAKSGLEEVSIETDELKLNIRKNATVAYAPAPPVPAAPSAPPAAAAPAPAAPAQPSADKPTAQADHQQVRSPMIGTFYRAADPDSPSFVSVGDEIKKGQTVCIIEAMKLFNEIESEVEGRVVKVLAENATPVEYDQPLFLVEPL